MIQIHEVTKQFKDKKKYVTALKHVSLNIREGEVIGLLGENGAGKTTLLRSIATLIEPSSGTIRVANFDTVQQSAEVKKRLGVLFGSETGLYERLTARENLEYFGSLYGLGKHETKIRIEKLAKMFGMRDYLDRRVGNFSKGMRQKVAIARAIVNKPEVLLLDEPLSALDMKLRKEMQLELMRMHKELGITFIFVTHDQEEALTMSNTVVVMNDGIIQQMGTPKHIYDEPVNTFVADFIGESNILEGTMLKDKLVRFLECDVVCVDGGFGENAPVYVVIRPEDVSLHKVDETGHENIFARGIVRSCVFKGVHYEMYVETSNGYMLQVQDYEAKNVGDEVSATITPDNIHVIKR